MGMTREQKLLGGVLAIAVGAFVFDRGVLGPQEASAGAALPVSGGLPVPRPSADGAPMLQPAVTLRPSVVSRRLADAAATLGISASDTGDAFAGMRPRPTAPCGTAPPSENAMGLTAVMPKQRIAIFDGNPVMVGQRVGDAGHRLVEVRERSAVLERDGVRIEVRLPRLPQHRP